jgi:hypothetical protein
VDDVDRANDVIEEQLARNIAAARGVPLPAGTTGECDLCGEWSGRLVEGLCAPCRDSRAARERRRR